MAGQRKDDAEFEADLQAAFKSRTPSIPAQLRAIAEQLGDTRAPFVTAYYEAPLTCHKILQDIADLLEGKS